MARYVHDYQDISGDPLRPQGMDPNYRGRYRGMRMGADGGQGAYGWYRWRHARELGGDPGYDRHLRQYHQPPHAYDWEMRGGGGLHNVRYDREFMRDYNANSPLFWEQRPRGDRYGIEYEQRGGHPIPRDTRHQYGYSNRGLSSSGFSEAWQHRPGHGSR